MKYYYYLEVAAEMLNCNFGDNTDPNKLHPELVNYLNNISYLLENLHGNSLRFKEVIASSVATWIMINPDKFAYDDSNIGKEKDDGSN